MEIKQGDVYRFLYNEVPNNSYGNLYWCFDGQLIVKQNHNGDLYLQDTYYADGKVFTLEQALQKGSLEFVCNFDDVEPIEKSEYHYYDKSDVFNLSFQHGCREVFYKKKGAQRSIENMKKLALDKIDGLKSNIEFQTAEVECLKEKIQRLKNGDTELYI